MKVGKLVYFDDIKDKELLEWLSDKTNRSAFIRTKLYDLMREEKLGIIRTQIIEKPTQQTGLNMATDSNMVAKASFLSSLKK